MTQFKNGLRTLTDTLSKKMCINYTPKKLIKKRRYTDDRDTWNILGKHKIKNHNTSLKMDERQK